MPIRKIGLWFRTRGRSWGDVRREIDKRLTYLVRERGLCPASVDSPLMERWELKIGENDETISIPYEITWIGRGYDGEEGIGVAFYFED